MQKIFVSLLINFCLITSLSAQSPNWLWAKPFGSGLADYGTEIGVDNFGNSYVAGSFQDFVTFGSTTLTSAGNDDFFIAKYDSGGNVIWAKKAGGIGFEWAVGMVVDVAGNSYVTGQFTSNNITFATTTLTNAGGSDIFIVKYDPAGNIVWAKKAGSAGFTSYDVAYDIAIDDTGNVYLTGSYYGGNISFGNITLSNSGESDIFIVKYDQAGNPLWARKAGGSEFEEAFGIGLDLTGNIYITGSFGNSLTIGSTTLTNVGGIYADVFVAKYDNAGNVIWAKSAGGTNVEGGRAISIDGSGNCYVTGIFESNTIIFGSTTLTNGASINGFVVKYDPSGNVLWAANAGGSDVAIDGNDNIYLTWGNVEKYDPTGNLVWTSIGGKGGTAIDVDNYGNSYITGSFDGTFNFGSTTLTTSGSEDVFVAKLDAGCTAAPLQPGNINGNANPCYGNSQNYSILPVAGASSYLWTLPSGWPGNSNSNSIAVMPGSGGGNITVAAVNSCGMSPVQTLSVNSFSSPSPAITQSGNILSTTTTFSSYQWYFNGNLIPGATAQNYIATQAGNYYVVVTDANNCNGQSNILSFIVGINEFNSVTGFKFYPNPVKEKFYLEREGQRIGEICLYDRFGRKILELYMEQKHAELNMQQLPASFYLLKTELGIIKIVKE